MISLSTLLGNDGRETDLSEAYFRLKDAFGKNSILGQTALGGVGALIVAAISKP
jgi:hypothetical protein